MQVYPYTLRVLVPPKDNLKSALRASKLSVKNRDIVVITSKVVSIGEGRALKVGSLSKKSLVLEEAQWYRTLRKSRYRKVFTIAGNALVGSAGVDESNGNGYYILYPKDPMKSARELRSWLMRTYRVKNIGLIISDSTSAPLRRGTVGFALAWSGFEPLKDYRGTRDLFGRPFEFEVANIADALATTASLVMGEGDEQTPVAVIRNAPVVYSGTRSKQKERLTISPQDDIFAPLFFEKKWTRSKKKKF